MTTGLGQLTQISPLHGSVQPEESVMAQADVSELRDKVRAMYKAVANEPHARFHFRDGAPPGAAAGLPSRRTRPAAAGSGRVVRRGGLPPGTSRDYPWRTGGRPRQWLGHGSVPRGPPRCRPGSPAQPEGDRQIQQHLRRVMDGRRLPSWGQHRGQCGVQARRPDRGRQQRPTRPRDDTRARTVNPDPRVQPATFAHLESAPRTGGDRTLSNSHPPRSGGLHARIHPRSARVNGAAQRAWTE